jgi:hypothetical protein
MTNKSLIAAVGILGAAVFLDSGAGGERIEKGKGKALRKKRQKNKAAAKSKKANNRKK